MLFHRNFDIIFSPHSSVKRFCLGKSEMISYYKGTTIPTSHIHMFDPENVTLACNIFRELVRWELVIEI
jgi:hypothetical protein